LQKRARKPDPKHTRPEKPGVSPRKLVHEAQDQKNLEEGRKTDPETARPEKPGEEPRKTNPKQYRTRKTW
jgi:hypothetical protein